MMLQQTPLPPPIPFDPNQLIPLIGVVGVTIVVGIVLYGLFKSDLAAAMAERIRSRIHRRSAELETDPGYVAELEERIEQTQRQIAELAERLDFAERLLAQKRERSLPGA